jgi:hypothetical protein
MSMLDQFLQEFISTNDRIDKIEKFIDTFDSDSSKWVYVDGEEGDHGIITYSYKGNIVCDYVCRGGDSDDYIFTNYGKALLIAEYIDTFIGN